MSKKWLAALGAIVSLSAHAFTPVSGTWIINSELNGKPGRGLAIDVQNGTVVMQVYGYESNGAPTFYMGTSTSYTGANTVTAPRVAVIPLKQYQGGRYLGSGDRSGTELKSLGNATLTFATATTGTITLPGESPVAMSRFDFSGYNHADAQSLLGEWVFAFIANSGSTVASRADDVVLSKIPGVKNSWGAGTVTSSDGLVDCEQDISGNNPGRTQCSFYDGATSSAKLLYSYVFTWSLNQGEGNAWDAKGNYVGPVWVQRVMDKTGGYTGLSRAAPVESNSKSAIHPNSVESLPGRSE